MMHIYRTYPGITSTYRRPLIYTLVRTSSVAAHGQKRCFGTAAAAAGTRIPVPGSMLAPWYEVYTEFVFFLHIIFAQLLQLPPCHFITQEPGSHSRHFPALPPPSFLSREEFTRSSLVDSRRIVHTHAARCYEYLLPGTWWSIFAQGSFPSALAGLELTQSTLSSHDSRPRSPRGRPYLVPATD